MSDLVKRLRHKSSVFVAKDCHEAADRIEELEGDRSLCVAGCTRFTGSEMRHHPDCPHYEDSFSQMYDQMQAKLQRVGALPDKWRETWEEQQSVGCRHWQTADDFADELREALKD